MKTDCSRISPVSRLMKPTVTGQRARVGEVLLPALLQRCDGRVELERAELDGEVAGVVLDRRDVVDRLAQAALLGVDEPGEGLLLDVDQVRDVEDVVEPRERAARTGSINGSQDGDSSWTGERATGGALSNLPRGTAGEKRDHPR
jgi:hypothetical protein